MVQSILVVFVFMLGLNGPLLAQQPPDPLAEQFFPPELVMQNQQALGLSEEQKNVLKAELQQAQARFNELQWQLQSEVETLADLGRQDRVDEPRVLAQLDKILNVERGIKRAQVTLIVRIKNTLTVEQQSRLREIRKKAQGK